MSVKSFQCMISVLALCSVVVSCKSKQSQQQTQQISDYTVMTLAPRSVTLYNDYPATIQGAQVVEIRPKVDGYLEKIYVKEGQHVHKGQLLFTIFNPSYAQTIQSVRASIKSAEADISSAEIDYDNKKALASEKIVGAFQLNEAKNTLATKKAALAELKASLATAHTNESYTKLYAPASGIISTIPYKVGALVSSTSAEALTTLSNATEVYAYFSVAEKDLLSNKLKGNTAQLILANDSLYGYTGTISAATGIVNTATGSLQYKGTFPNPNGLLKSGNFATVRIPYNLSNVLVIPQSATYETQDKRFVYVLGANNYIESVMITTTATSDGQYFIVNSGLKEGDKIVLTGVGTSLKDSMQIKPVSANTDSVFSLLNKN